MKLVETTDKLAEEEKNSLSIAFYAPFMDKDVRIKMIAAKPSE